MSNVKTIDIFQVVSFPNLTHIRDDLKKKFINEGYSCAKTFTLAEVASLFPQNKISDVLNVFSDSITEDQSAKLLDTISCTVINYMERSYLHKKFPEQYGTIKSIQNKSLSVDEALGMHEEQHPRFCSDFGYDYPDMLTANVEIAISVLLGLYHKPAGIFTVKGVNNLLFSKHEHKLPMHKALSKDSKAFEEGKLIDRETYDKELYNIIVAT